jgi:hypothetical protein
VEAGFLPMRTPQELAAVAQAYTAAIEAGSMLAQLAGPNWQPDERDRLAQVFVARGLVLAEVGMRREGMLDFTRASRLLSQLISDGIATPDHITGCLTSIYSFVRTAALIPDWEEVAEGAYSFLLCFQKAEQGRGCAEEEPSWADTVRDFAALVGAFDAESRAAICAALGKRAEGFKLYLHWE